MCERNLLINTQRRTQTNISTGSMRHVCVCVCYSLCQSSNQVFSAGLRGGRLAGSIWLIAPPWQWATRINGRPELFVLCVRACVLYLVCCGWGPRCRISMWEHEATAVTLTSAAAADEQTVYTGCRSGSLCTAAAPLALRECLNNPAGQASLLCYYNFMYPVHATQRS